MKTINLILLILLTIALCSCQSNYRGRMVRVKKQKIGINPFVKKDNIIQNSKTNLKQAIEGFKGSDELISVANTTILRKTCNSTENKGVRKIKKTLNRYPPIPKVILNQPQDSIGKDSIQELSEEEVFARDQYKKANIYSWISLFLLLSTIITGIGLFFAIVLSIKAIRIYRKYKNPGMNEYPVLAWGVSIASIFIVLFLIVFFVMIFNGGII